MLFAGKGNTKIQKKLGYVKTANSWRFNFILNLHVMVLALKNDLSNFGLLGRIVIIFDMFFYHMKMARGNGPIK